MQTPPNDAPEKPKASSFQIYSLAKVAEHKERDSNMIQAIPIEQMLLGEGGIGSNPTAIEVGGTDADGRHYNTATMTDRAISADWLPQSGGYQMTAPDVRKGERVLLWRMADSETIYWSALGFDNHLRRGETVVMMFSATEEEVENPDEFQLNHENAYVLTVSTHDGHFTLTTSKQMDEPTAWAIQLNTKEGKFLVTEENGNEVEIDGVNSYLNLLNADKSQIELDRRDIRMFCEDNFSLKAGKTVHIETQKFTIKCDTYQLDASSSIKMTTQTFDVNTNTLTVTSQSNQFNTPASTFSGTITCAGLTAPKASIGGVTIENGRINCTALTASSTVTAPNLRYT